MSSVHGPRAARGWALVCAAAMTLGAGAAHADSLFGASAIITDRGCAPADTSCGGNAKLTPNKLYGGFGQGLSTSTVALPGSASASADVSFGASYLPTVRLGSWSGAQTRTGASTTTYRAFTYTGDQAIDFAILGQLHYFNSGDPTANEDAGDGIMNVAFSLWRVSDIAGVWGPGATANDIISNSNIGFADCGGGAIAVGGYNSVGDVAGEHTATLGMSQSCAGGAILMNPGDSFVVVASLQAISNRGGFTDATGTFVVQYDDVHTLIDATGQSAGAGFLERTVTEGASIPEPASWAMLITGFLGAGAALRRRRSSLAAAV
jgi:hypothetical protein